MKDGLYSVQFATHLNAGAGVLLAMDGRMWGGDAVLYFVGTYTEEGDRMSAKIAAYRHRTIPGVSSLLGTDYANIALDGFVSGDVVLCTGTAAEIPGLLLKAALRRVSD